MEAGGKEEKLKISANGGDLEMTIRIWLTKQPFLVKRGLTLSLLRGCGE